MSNKMMTKKQIQTAILLSAFLFLSLTTITAQTKKIIDPNDLCYRLLTHVDPSLERIDIEVSNLTGDEVLQGIECLLRLEGNRKPSDVTGYTRFNPNSSSGVKPFKKKATIEIAALYYISYIFYNNWEHAWSVRLYNLDYKNKPKMNTKKTVKRAYRSYKFWFETVKEIGLEEARKRKLDPLSNSGIGWS